MITLILNPDLTMASLLPMFALQMAVGALFGYGLGRAMAVLLNRVHLRFDGLYPVQTIAFVLVTYSLTALVGGNGFLAVYVAGIVIGQRRFIHRAGVIQFHDGLDWLLQIAMFLTLGLLVFPSQLVDVAGTGLLIAAVLIVVARPISVFVVLAFTRFSFREKVFISWVGLRGAAPIVLATFPLLAGIERSGQIFNLVFFVVLTSVLLQGTLVKHAARWLGVEDTDPAPAQSPLAKAMQDGILGNDTFELTLEAESPGVGRQIVDLALPDDVLILLIGREGDVIVPKGATVLNAGDRLLVLAASRPDEIRMLLNGPTGPNSTIT
jgi:cell volume regulation protein A